MATFELTIDTENEAFQDGMRGIELTRILKETARRVENDSGDMGFSFAVQDINGNTVGHAELCEKGAGAHVCPQHSGDGPCTAHLDD